MCEQATALELATAFRCLESCNCSDLSPTDSDSEKSALFRRLHSLPLGPGHVGGDDSRLLLAQSHWLHSVPSGASLKRRMWIHRPPTNHERALQPHRGGKMAHAPDTPAHRLHQADQGSETLGDLDSNRDRDNRVLVLPRNVGCCVAPFPPGFRQVTRLSGFDTGQLGCPDRRTRYRR